MTEAVHESPVLLVLVGSQLRLLGDHGRLVPVDEGATDAAPQPLAGRSVHPFFRPVVGLARAQEFFADLVCMLVEEAVQDDCVCLVEGRIQPLFVAVLRRCVFLIIQREPMKSSRGSSAYVDLAQVPRHVDDIRAQEVVQRKSIDGSRCNCNVS